MSEHKRIEHAVDYLRENFSDDVSVPDVASACGYSEGYFYRKFKEVTGRTPVQYLVELRIEEAKRWLVYSDLPIGEIAVHVGFVNTHYFSRVFREAVGRSASEFRSNARNASHNRASAVQVSPDSPATTKGRRGPRPAKSTGQ
jgi:AraC-like DNA-binding protein